MSSRKLYAGTVDTTTLNVSAESGSNHFVAIENTDTPYFGIWNTSENKHMIMGRVSGEFEAWGKVGVGQAVGTEALEVTGNIKINDGNHIDFYDGLGTLVKRDFGSVDYVSNGDRIIQLQGNDYTINGENGGDIKIGGPSSYFFYDYSTQRIGINTTTPSNDFEVNGNIKGTHFKTPNHMHIQELSADVGYIGWNNYWNGDVFAKDISDKHQLVIKGEINNSIMKFGLSSITNPNPNFNSAADLMQLNGVDRTMTVYGNVYVTSNIDMGYNSGITRPDSDSLEIQFYSGNFGGAEKIYRSGSYQMTYGSSGVTHNFISNITYTGTLSQSSDDRLKHNEEPVLDALGTINKLKLYKYDKTMKMLDADFNGDLGDIPHHKEFGFIAQEVLEIPELAFLVKDGVKEHEEVPYSLDYQGITNVAIQAIQELSAQVKTQQEQINSLLQIVDELRQNHAAAAAGDP